MSNAISSAVPTNDLAPLGTPVLVMTKLTPTHELLKPILAIFTKQSWLSLRTIDFDRFTREIIQLDMRLISKSR